jgi:hypothetical protein
MPNEQWNDMLDEMDKDKEANTFKKKFWQPPTDKEGTFIIRFLPPLKSKGEKKFYFSHKTHWMDKASYECLKQTLVDKNGQEHTEEDCPICNYVQKLYRSSERNSEEWKVANDLRAKPRYDYRIIIRTSSDYQSDELKPQFYESGQKVYDMLYHIMKETEFGIIVDPFHGRDYNLVKKGKGRQAKYEQSLPAVTESPIYKERETLDKVMKEAVKLDYNSLVEFVSMIEMQKALEAFVNGETVPTPKRASASTSEDPPPDSEFAGKEKAPASKAPASEEGKDAEIDKILEEFQY